MIIKGSLPGFPHHSEDDLLLLLLLLVHESGDDLICTQASIIVGCGMMYGWLVPLLLLLPLLRD